MSNRWMKAAVKYEAAKKPGFKACKKHPKSVGHIPTLAEFMASLECRAAKALLAASSLFVILGELETKSGKVIVVLDCHGLEKHSRYHLAPICVKEANKLLEKIYNDDPVFDPVLFIRQELDRIAGDAP